MTWGRWWWPIFLIVTSIAFLVPEVFALVTGQFKNTLSDYARYELNVTTPTEAFSAHSAAWLLSLGVWLVVAFWLTWHVWWAKF